MRYESWQTGEMLDPANLNSMFTSFWNSSLKACLFGHCLAHTTFPHNYGFPETLTSKVIIWPQWYHEPCYFSQTLVNVICTYFDLWVIVSSIQTTCMKLYYVLYQNSNSPTCPVHRMGTIAVINLRNWTFILCAFLMNLQVFLGQWEQMVACCGPTTHYMWFLGGEKRFWPSSSCRLIFDLVKWQKVSMLCI